jgi:hypothetical protein
VLQALNDQLVANTTLLDYVKASRFFIGYKGPIGKDDYAIILEPGVQTEGAKSRSVGPSRQFIEEEYLIDIYARSILTGIGVQGTIIGHGTKKGVLDFIDDIKAAIVADLTLGYDSAGSSVSEINSSASFDLDASNRYLSVKINNNERTDWDQIDCGSSTLAGADVAVNIQAALRALSLHANDGYEGATCTFSASKKFTITSSTLSPTSSVVVTAGASNDCSALLGFDDPTEVIGKKIVSIKFGTVEPNNDFYPVRFRKLPVTIREEVKQLV